MLATHRLENAAAPNVAPQPDDLRPWLGAVAESGAGSRHLLILRFAVFNVVALALLGAAWLKGWVTLVIDGDSTRLVALIAIVFGVGLCRISTRRARRPRRTRRRRAT